MSSGIAAPGKGCGRNGGYMRVKIDIEKAGGIVLMRIDAKDLGPEQGEELKRAVRQVVAKGPVSAVVVNFSFVEYMSSVFLSVLIELLKELDAQGVTLGLAELNHKNLDIIRTTKLDSVLRIFSGVAEAVESLRKK